MLKKPQVIWSLVTGIDSKKQVIMYKTIKSVNFLQKEYNRLNSITVNADKYEHSNEWEIMKAVTNCDTGNLATIYSKCYDADNNAFKVKYDESAPFLNVDGAKGYFLNVSEIGGNDSVKIVEDDSEYYLRLGSGVPNGSLNICYPSTGLVQALTTTNDTQLIDAVGTRQPREGENLQGDALSFNDSDNYIDTGIKVQGQTPIEIEVNINLDEIGLWQGIIGCAEVTGGAKGFVIYSRDTDNLQLNINSYEFVPTTVEKLVLGINNIKFKWSGLAGEIAKLTLNGVDTDFVPTVDWIGESAHSLKIMQAYDVHFNGRLFNYSYTINNQIIEYFDCEERGGLLYSRNGVINTPQGSGLDTTFFVRDDRNTVNRSNNVGYGIKNYFEFDGVTNYIDTGIKVEGQTAIDFNGMFTFKSVSSYVNCLYGCGADTASEKGFRILTIDSDLYLQIADGVSRFNHIFNLGLITNSVFDINLKWSGISGEPINVICNGVSYFTNAINSWVGGSHYDVSIGVSPAATYLYKYYGKLYNYSYTINNNTEVSKTLDKDYDVQIEGTVNDSQWGYNRRIPLGVNNIPVQDYDTIYTGLVKANANKINANCFIFNLSNNIAGFNGETIIEYIAEDGVTPIIVGDYLKTDIIGWVAYVKTSDGKFIPFIQPTTSTLNTCVDVNSNTTHAIAGTVTVGSYGKQDKYFYKNNEGFSIDGTDYIPASQLNIGYDTEGNVLTNPPIKNGLNSGCELQQPLIHRLIVADKWYKYYTPMYNFDVIDENTTLISVEHGGSIGLIEQLDNGYILSNPTLGTSSYPRVNNYFTNITTQQYKTYRIRFKYKKITAGEVDSFYLVFGVSYILVPAPDDEGIINIDKYMNSSVYALYMALAPSPSTTEHFKIQITDFTIEDISDYIGATPKEVAFEDIVPNFNEYAFADVIDSTNEIKNLITYNQEKTEEDIDKIYSCMNPEWVPFQIFNVVHNGENVVDDGDNVTYTEENINPLIN